MLLYRNIVIKAITEVIEPTLRKTINQSLTTIYGANWFEKEGREILTSYQYYDDIDYAIKRGINPVDAMDIPALIYLLSPSVNEEETDGMEEMWGEQKLIDVIANFYSWDEMKKRKILRIRSIRNGSVHDKMDKNVLLSPETIKNGTQELKWLEELEQALLLMNPLGNLNKYKNELSKAIAQGNNSTSTDDKDSVVPNGVLTYLREMESIRNDCNRIMQIDFMNAPVKAPIVGNAPWSHVKSDLDNLPWPSKVNEPTPNNSPNNAPNKPLNPIDKGVNKLFGLFNKKI